MLRDAFQLDMIEPRSAFPLPGFGDGLERLSPTQQTPQAGGATSPSSSGSDTRVEDRTHYTQGGLTTGGAAPSIAAIAPGFLPQIVLIMISAVVVFSDEVWPYWIPYWVRFVVALAAVTVVACISIGIFLKAFRRVNDIRGLPMALDKKARINVACWNDQRPRFEAYTDTAFEPEQFRVLLPDIHKNAQTSRWHFPPHALIYLLILPFAVKLTPLTVTLIGAVWCVCTTIVLWQHRKPTYLRIFPGRIEIRRYPLWGSASPEVDRINMRDRQIRLDLKNHCAYIGNWTSGVIFNEDYSQNIPRYLDGVYTIPLWSVMGRDKAMELLYLSAISTAEAPEHDAE